LAQDQEPDEAAMAAFAVSWRREIGGRSLGLKSANDWRAYTKSGKLPADIPAGANRTYAKKGWLDWGDWLGKNDSGKQDTP
jgi:hypothetical protein